MAGWVCSPECSGEPLLRTATSQGCDVADRNLRKGSLTAGVDLRAVAGRLGHGGGGATTLRVYTAWVNESDRRAAEILGTRLPRPTRKPVK